VTALLFDCDGVLADTERDGHLPAFNQTFAEFGLPVQWSEEEYGRRLQIGGGKERIRSLLTPEFTSAAGLPADADARAELVGRWHRRKTEIFTAMVRSGGIAPRPGVERIARAAAAAGWKLAVASTSAADSVQAVLESAVGTDLAAQFSLFAGDVVPRKKPSPDIYLLALQKLGTPAAEAVVIEDSRNGLLAAAGAGIGCVITLSTYTQHEDMTGATLVVSSLGDPGGPDVSVLANHTGTPVHGYVGLPSIAACQRIAEGTNARPSSSVTRLG
jgi:HAD superfamily hydrolase (TIGR01509 family)